MSGMFWIALELSIPKNLFNIMLSLTVKKVEAFKFAESDDTVELFLKTRFVLRNRPVKESD